MKIGIIGPTSQLGTDLHLLFPTADLIFKSKVNFLTPVGPTGIKRMLGEGKWDYLINCAALTDVNYCEGHPDEAALVHITAVRELAEFCQKAKIHLIHISTDFVFDGEKGNYTVNDTPKNPVNVYGETKLIGEKQIFEVMDEKYITIIRTSSLFGVAQGRTNFITKIIESGMKKEEIKANPERIFAPTSTISLARKINNKILSGDIKNTNLVHSVGKNSGNQVEIASFIFQSVPALNHVKIIEDRKQKTRPIRPKNSTLISSEGWELPDWKGEIFDFLLNKGWARPACVLEVEADSAYSVSKIWEKLGYKQPDYRELVRALRESRESFLLGKKPKKGDKKSIMDLFKEVEL